MADLSTVMSELDDVWRRYRLGRIGATLAVAEVRALVDVTLTDAERLVHGDVRPSLRYDALSVDGVAVPSGRPEPVRRSWSWSWSTDRIGTLLAIATLLVLLAAWIIAGVWR